MLNPIKKVVRFYVTGFREMTLGKTLWLLIIIKIIIIFAVIKWIFFPKVLNQYDHETKKADHVWNELVKDSSE